MNFNPFIRNFLCAWPAWLAALLLALTAPTADGNFDHDEAFAKNSTRAKQLAKHRASKRGKATTKRHARKTRSKRHAKREKVHVKRRRGYVGKSVPKSTLRTEALPKPSGDLWLYAENFREEIRLSIYNDDGSFNQEALASLDHAFRCKRTKEERAVDPRLFEILSIIQDHFDGKRIVLISGFRFQKNEGSRHFHASAMDIRIEGVSGRELYKFAESLDTGGMGVGLYPNSQFVHVDFRAPGEPSYRWTDRGRRRNRGKSPSKAWRGKPKS